MGRLGVLGCRAIARWVAAGGLRGMCAAAGTSDMWGRRGTALCVLKPLICFTVGRAEIGSYDPRCCSRASTFCCSFCRCSPLGGRCGNVPGRGRRWCSRRAISSTWRAAGRWTAACRHRGTSRGSSRSPPSLTTCAPRESTSSPRGLRRGRTRVMRRGSGTSGSRPASSEICRCSGTSSTPISSLRRSPMSPTGSARRGWRLTSS